LDHKTANVLLDEARRHLESTLQALRDLDAKAIEFLKIDAILLGLVATAAGLLTTPISGTATMRPWWTFALPIGVLGATALAASMTLAVTALFRRDVALGMIRLGRGASLSYEEAVVFSIETYERALETNRSAVDGKGILVETSAAALLVAAVLLGVAGIGFMVGAVL
jgi:hypothetical protein